MAEKTLTLRAELVDQLESLASNQGRTVDDVLSDLLGSPSKPETVNNWALNLAKQMKAANIEWQNIPDVSINSRKIYQGYLFQRWQATQQEEDTND